MIETILLAVLALGGLSSSKPPVPSEPAAGPAIAVGPNVRISDPDPEVAEFEALAAADPANPKNLLACTMAMDPRTNAHRTVIYSSFDSGATWERTFVSSRSSFVGDPTCVYGFGDTAYAANLPIYIGPSNENEIAVLRSSDKGRTWKVVHSMPFIDREYLTVDRTNGPYRGRLYLHAQGEREIGEDKTGTQLQLLYSSNGGESFSQPVSPPGVYKYGVMTPGSGVVLDDGTLMIPFLPTRDGHDYVEVTWSNDGGASLAAPVVVAPQKGCSEAGIGVDIAFDESSGPYKGRLYTTFGDATGGRCQIKLAYSTDRGRTWSKPVLVSDERPRESGKGPDNFQPAIAVNSQGVVAVSWYDRRDSPDNFGSTLRLAASIDGGVSFGRSVRVSTGATTHPPNERYVVNAFAGGGRSRSKGRRGGAIWTMFYPEGQSGPGDTRQMVAAADGAFYPFWYDNRDGVSKLYTARVTVAGGAVRNGSADLADLEDVSERVTLDYSNSRYDPVQHTYTVDAILVNLSERAIAAPVKMRVTGLWSIAGAPRITNSQNGLPGVGAVWDLTRALEGGSLAPGASAKPFPLAFKLDHFRPLGRREGDLPFNESMFLWLESRVLAKPAP